MKKIPSGIAVFKEFAHYCHHHKDATFRGSVGLLPQKQYECVCRYIPKYVKGKDGKTRYGKAYLGLGKERCKCQHERYMNRFKKNRTLKDCPLFKESL